jgi:type II secretory ATPase GspE/PulE/Tfp pilus assembly ATPase PilB-like protein
MSGVNQVQVNTAAGLTFAQALRSFLRQDPNVIFVGEIRDEETAELAVQASLTGHLVLSTLHTSSSAGALPRLLDMKAEPYLLASSISAVIAQRVVRVTCNVCKTQYPASESEVAEIAQVLGKLWKPTGDKVLLSKGEGCTECGNTGFKGRIGIYEVLTVSDKIGHLILERASAQDIEKLAIENGMLSMKQDGYLRVLEGVTTLDEVLRVAQE